MLAWSVSKPVEALLVRLVYVCVCCVGGGCVDEKEEGAHKKKDKTHHEETTRNSDYKSTYSVSAVALAS